MDLLQLIIKFLDVDSWMSTSKYKLMIVIVDSKVIQLTAGYSFVDNERWLQQVHVHVIVAKWVSLFL